MKEKTKQGWHKFGKLLWSSALPILAAAILNAFSVFTFVRPNNFAPGGTSGISVLLEYATGGRWNAGIFLLMLNAPLFFVAFFCLSKRGAIMATTEIAINAGLLIALDYLPEQVRLAIQYQADNAFLAAVAHGILFGTSLAIMIRSCGTSGGSTVLASVVNKKYRNISVGMLTAAFDACVVVASFFVYYGNADDLAGRLDPVLLALVSLFVTSKVSDIIIQGFKTAYKFEIITTHTEEIAQEIMEKLHHGVTHISAEGMYSHEGKGVLVCIIRKRQIAQLQKILRSYPDTFSYFSPVSEVYGQFAK